MLIVPVPSRSASSSCATLARNISEEVTFSARSVTCSPTKRLLEAELVGQQDRLAILGERLPRLRPGGCNGIMNMPSFIARHRLRRASALPSTSEGRPMNSPQTIDWDEQEFAEVRPGIFGATVHTPNLTATLYRYDAGSSWETHAHPQDQMTYVMSGAIDFVVDGAPCA